MAKYEITIVFAPSLTEENIDAIIEKLKIKPSDSEGKVQKVKNWGKRHLAYPIKKEKEGVYMFVEAEIDEKQTKELSHKLEADDSVLRFLLVRI